MRCPCGQEYSIVAFTETHESEYYSTVEVRLEYKCRLGCKTVVNRIGNPGCPSVESLLTAGRDWAQRYARITSGT